MVFSAHAEVVPRPQLGPPVVARILRARGGSSTTARSFAQTVDALGKLATMLGIPAEALLEDIPGFTEEKIQRILTKYGYPSIRGDESQPMPEVT